MVIMTEEGGYYKGMQADDEKLMYNKQWPYS